MSTPQPPMNIPAAFQLTVNMTQSGQLAQVVMGVGGLGLVNAPQAKGQQVLQHFWSTFRTMIALATTCTGAQLREAVPDGQVYELAAPTTPAGAGSGAIALAGASTLLLWRTPNGGRANKGRTYLPGVPAAALANDGRTYEAAHRALAVTAAAAWVNLGTTVPETYPCVLSRSRQMAPIITSGQLSNVIGVQRRRMRA